MGASGEMFAPGAASAKHPRALRFWQKSVLLLSVGSFILFCVTLTMDAKFAFAWSGSSNLSDADDQHLRSPAIPSRLLLRHDDPTCFSRTQQNLLRRTAKQFPTPRGLAVAWKRYGELHRSCSFQKNNNWTDVYLKQENDGCNYLIYLEGGAGLGNRLLSLTSAFLYALATDRVLLVDSRKTMFKLLCEPFSNSSWLLPDDFPYEEVEKAPPLGKARDANWEVPLVNFHLEHVQNGGDQLFFCDDTHFQLLTVPWVAWTSNQYYVPKLFMIPSLWRRLSPMFDSKSMAFTHLSRLLILPNNDVWAHIVRVYWGYLSGTSSRIGLQIRLHGRKDLAAFDDAVNERIMACMTSNGILPTIIPSENITALSAMLTRKFMAERWNQPSSDAVVLVASLQSRYFEEMLKTFTKYPNANSSIIRVQMMTHEGRQNNSLDQSRNALVEIWLLSYSDVLVTSAYSTFGYVAQGLGALTPHILNIRGEQSSGRDGGDACYLGQSPEPCTHFPFSPACQDWNVTDAHRTWIQRHVRECQDQPTGLQLGDFPESGETPE